MIVVETTKIDPVRRVKPAVFEDFRGFFIETYNRQDYQAAGIDIDFVQDDLSISSQHVLRGLHGDTKTWKLVSCISGRIYLVVVDCRPESPSQGKWESFIISEQNRHQILIPPGFANGHLVLSELGIFAYKQSAYYDPGSQFSYRWDDPAFGIWWPVKAPLLSPRDEAGKFV